jgi:Fe-S oxidoreductase
MVNLVKKKSMGLLLKRYRFGQYFRKWYEKMESVSDSFVNGKVCLFSDEFTNYYDVSVGIDAYELLTALGYEVILDHEESGRAFIQRFFEEAKAITNTNVVFFQIILLLIFL